MDIIIEIDNLNFNQVIFNSPIPNSIIENGLFNRICYSTSDISMSGLNIFFKLEDYKIEKFYNKFKINYEIDKNHVVINKLINIEKKILSKINIRNKSPIYKLSDNFLTKNIKINQFLNNSKGICLKISGIWQTKNNFGLTFRFQQANVYKFPLNHQ